MPLVLHRFPLSNFSEKARALLAFKKLDHEIREHRLGLPQLEIYRLSGQRLVPVIEHEGRVVHDSTRIAHYLDERFPALPRLVPPDEPRRREVLALEDRLDRAFGGGPIAIWLDHALDHREHLDLLALEIHGLPVVGARALGAVARAFRGAFRARTRARVDEAYAMLDECAERLSAGPYLVGDEPTLADVTAAGLLFHLEFPPTPSLWDPSFAGRGVDHVVARYPSVFTWRRKLYADRLR